MHNNNNFHYRNSDCVETLISNGSDVHKMDHYKRTPLHYATANCNYESIWTLLSSGSKVDVQDRDGVTPLMLACAEDLDLDNEARIVQYFLTHKAQVSLADNKGYNALDYAASKGNSDAVMHLFDTYDFTGAELERAAIVSCAYGHQAVLQMISSKNPAVFEAEFNGLTPLLVASLNGHDNIVEIVLPKLNSVDEVGGNLKWNSLHAAAKSGFTGIVSELLTKSGNRLIDSCDTYKRTALMLAAENGHADSVNVLLNNKADVNKVDVCGRSALFRAAANGHEDIVEVLIEKGADVKVKDKNGKTATHFAASAGQTDALMILVSHEDMSLNEDKKGMTPVHWASLNGQEECLEILLQNYDSELDKEDGLLSPVHCAALKNNQSCLEMLIANNFKVNRVFKGKSPLILAVENNCVDVVKVLLEHGANVDEKHPKLGLTLLMMAAKNDHSELVETLLENGAKFDSLDENGDSALHLAIKANSDPCSVAVLKKCSKIYVNKQNNDGKR